MQERHGSAEDRIQRLESQLDEKSTEVAKLQQRLRINEEHNSRLSTTVDKLLQGTLFQTTDKRQIIVSLPIFMREILFGSHGFIHTSVFPVFLDLFITIL